MFAALLVVAAFCAPSAFSAPPRSKVLALRGGGVSNDRLLNTMAGLLIVPGLQGWYAPKKTAEMYGLKDISDEEIFFLRALQGITVVQGVTMLAAAESDLAQAAIVCLFGQAMATTANIALLEKLEVKTGPVIGCIALFGAVAELARRGVIAADLGSNINTIWLLLSVFEMIKPQPVLDAFLGKREASALSKSMFQNFSWVKVNTGLFLLVGKITGKRGLGVAAAAASNTLNVIATCTRAGKIGVKKGGLIFWGVVSGTIALLAFKNELAK